MMKIHKDEEVIRWTLDQLQSELTFEVRHLMISHVKGEFCEFEASVLTNGRDFSTADIALNIKSKSVYTGDAHRDSQLRGSDFLCVDQYRLITFTSTSISPEDNNRRMVLRGDLKIAGITRNIKLDMQMGSPSTDSWGDETARVTITGKIRRDDWNLRWTTAMEAEGFLIGDEIVISCKMELVSAGQHDAQREQDSMPPMRIAT
jgi:polyisoprenoid-binding protein YceI